MRLVSLGRSTSVDRAALAAGVEPDSLAGRFHVLRSVVSESISVVDQLDFM